jgi:cbb3-type cytochrome oxidase maturation protein
MTLLILIVFLGFLIWGIKSRQFHNIEDVKYRVLNDTDNEDTVDETPEEK